MIGWLADFFRAAWGLLYWNLRKSLFRLRRGRGRCPCQSPSDSGKAWVTGCEASLSWDRPSRFRRVCPLLQQDKEGNWRCSVDTAEVRPFWGRLAGFYGGGILAIYLLAVLTAFTGLRVIGYRVQPWTLAWPPAWHQLDRVRSEYFMERARQAYADRKVNEAIMSLTLAYQLDTDNYAAGLQLAQLWQTGHAVQAAQSNQIYDHLMRDHPEQRTGTAQAWYRALLARGDFDTIGKLSADALRFDSDHAAPWLHALLFAIRQTGDPAPLHRIMADPTGLDAETLTLLTLEATVREEPLMRAISALQNPSPSLLTAYGAYYRVNRLLQLGAAREAQILLERTGARMGERERISTQLDVYAAMGWGSLRRSLVDTLLAGPSNLPTVELLCAHLIRHPDASLTTLLFDRLEASPLPATSANYGGYAALYCTAGVNRDFERLGQFSHALRQISGSSFHTLNAADLFFQHEEPSRRAQAILPLLQPLSIDVAYALYQRFPHRPSSTAAP